MKIIDADWRPVEEVPSDSQREREQNELVLRLFLGALKFFAWAVTLALLI